MNEIREHCCSECVYLGFGVKRNGDEYFYCMCEHGGRTDDEFEPACKYFKPENEDEADNY